jgi:hypothetical protein
VEPVPPFGHRFKPIATESCTGEIAATRLQGNVRSGSSRPGRASDQVRDVRYAPKAEVHGGFGRNRLRADAAIGVSSHDATGMTLMTETVTIACPSVARAAVSRRRSAKPTTVSASAMAQHLDCSRAYIGKLEAEGVIQRQGDGFRLDQSRVAYLRFLRRERQQSPRTEADAAYIAAKTEMLQLRLIEKKHELVRQADVDALIDGIVGVTLTHLSSLPARCAPRGDLAIRRSIERVVFEVRTEIANVCQQMAKKCGEPPLDDDA